MYWLPLSSHASLTNIRNDHMCGTRTDISSRFLFSFRQYPCLDVVLWIKKCVFLFRMPRLNGATRGDGKQFCTLVAFCSSKSRHAGIASARKRVKETSFVSLIIKIQFIRKCAYARHLCNRIGVKPIFMTSRHHIIPAPPFVRGTLRSDFYCFHFECNLNLAHRWRRRKTT